MSIEFLLRGLIIGLAIAAPVGPIGILCIKRSLSHGKLSGFISGIGAATADGIYGLIAAFGLTIISSFLIEQKLWIQLIGLIFLIYLGIKIFFEKPKITLSGKNDKNNLIKDYFSTLVLTITNPMTILSFIAIFAGAGLANTNNYLSAPLLVLGVFLGSLLWWAILSLIIGSLKGTLNESKLKWINWISGLIILGFSLFIMIDLLGSI